MFKNNIVKFSSLTWFVASLTISLSLFVPNGYSIGAILILIFSFSAPFIKTNWKLEASDLIFISSLLLYSLGMFFLVYTHEISVRGFDKPSRFLIVILPFLFLLRIKPQNKILLYSCVFGGLGAFIVAFYDKAYLGLERAGGDHNPIMFGGIAVLLSALCLNYALHCYKKSQLNLFYFAIAGFLGGMSASFLSGSKGGWLVLPIAISFLFWSYRTVLKKSFYRYSAILLVTIVSVVTFIPSIGVMDRVKTLIIDVELLLNGSDKETSVSHRTELWKASLYMFEHSPLIGVGKSGQEPFKNNLVEKNISHKSILMFTHAHNEYLNELGIRGVLGLILLLNIYLIPLSLFLMKIKKYPSNWNIKVFAISGALVPICYMVLALTQAMFTHNISVMMYAFPIVFFWAATRWAEREERGLGNIA